MCVEYFLLEVDPTSYFKPTVLWYPSLGFRFIPFSRASCQPPISYSVCKDPGNTLKLKAVISSSAPSRLSLPLVCRIDFTLSSNTEVGIRCTTKTGRSEVRPFVSPRVSGNHLWRLTLSEHPSAPVVAPLPWCRWWLHTLVSLSQLGSFSSSIPSSTPSGIRARLVYHAMPLSVISLSLPLSASLHSHQQGHPCGLNRAR